MKNSIGKRTIYTVFAVLIGLICSFCTVQKRVHRPGWHIQWNKKMHAGTNLQKEEKHQLDETRKLIVETNSSAKQEQSDLHQDQLVSNERCLSSTPESHKKRKRLKPNNLVKRSSNSTRSVRSTIPQNAKSADAKDNGTMSGIVLIITSLVAAALMLVLLLGIVNVETSVLVTIAIVCLGISSALFFTLGLFLIVRSAVERKHPEKRKKRNDKMKLQRASSNYKPDKLNFILAAIAVAIGLGLIILIPSTQ